jgi:hypothetical protein
MAKTFTPRLSILSESQRRLWPELSEVPSAFVLCGGTAVALHLGHRASVDFDFVAAEEFDPDELCQRASFLAKSRTLQKAANTLTCQVDRGGAVRLSFFGTPTIRLIAAPHVAPDNNLKIAALVDLAGMKAAVVQKRAEAKDYLDVDAIIHQGGVDLPTALAAGRAIYGQSFNPELTLKSLCYFGDGNLASLPQAIQERLTAAVMSVDLNRLPELMRPTK